MCAVLVVLGQTGDGNLQVKFVLDYLTHDLHLSPSAIRNDEVGEWMFFFHHSRVSTSHHLLHAGVVIGSLDRFDNVPAIVGLAGFTLLEYHASGHRICSADVAVIETFDGDGQSVHAQRLLQLLHQAYALLLGVQLVALCDAVLFVLQYVKPAQFKQCFLVPFLWYSHLYSFKWKFHVERNDNFLTFTAVTPTHFNNSCNQKFLVLLLQALAVLEGECLRDAPVYYVEIVDEGHFLIILDIEYVDVMERVAHHLAATPIVLQLHVAPFDYLGFFKPHFSCQALHVGHHLSLQGCGVALQNLDCLADLLHVFLVGLSSDAWCLAVLNVIFETFLVFPGLHALSRDGFVAAAQRIEVLDEVEQCVQHTHVAVGAKVGPIAFVDLPCLEDTREILVGDHDARVRLAVLQQDIIAWCPLFYEVVLQQECVFLGVYDDIFYIIYLAYKHGRLAVVVLLIKV